MPRTLEPLACWAVTAPGMEFLAASELTALGIVPGLSEPGGVEFSATRPRLAEALLWLRTISRITVRLATFEAKSFRELERHGARIPWGTFLPAGSAVHFRVTSRKSRLYHQDGIAERLERAVLASVKGTRAVRGAAEAEGLEEAVAKLPEVQRFVVRVFRDEVQISADASGALLHLRGWRQEVGKAPLRETLAAGLILASGWGQKSPLVDPFCGSGTIPIEAAQMARRMAPGRARRFAAELWPGFEPHMRAARATALAGELPQSTAPIEGLDRDAGAIRAAMANAERAEVAADIAFTCAPISRLVRSEHGGSVITNPPYGVRVGERARLRDLYASLGHVVRTALPDWSLAFLSADRVLDGQVGIELRELFRTTNGGIPVRGLRSAR